MLVKSSIMFWLSDLAKLVILERKGILTVPLSIENAFFLKKIDVGLYIFLEQLASDTSVYAKIESAGSA